MDITFPRSRLARLADIAITALTTRDINRMETSRRATATSPSPTTTRRYAAATREIPRALADGSLMQARVGPLGPYFGALRR